MKKWITQPTPGFRNTLADVLTTAGDEIVRRVTIDQANSIVRYHNASNAGDPTGLGPTTEYGKGPPDIFDANQVTQWNLHHPEPVVASLFCPNCKTRHVDKMEWATKPHKTHLCEYCGMEWKPFEFNTVGVADPEHTPSRSEMRAGFADWVDNSAHNPANDFMHHEMFAAFRAGTRFGATGTTKRFGPIVLCAGECNGCPGCWPL